MTRRHRLYNGLNRPNCPNCPNRCQIMSRSRRTAPAASNVEKQKDGSAAAAKAKVFIPYKPSSSHPDTDVKYVEYSKHLDEWKMDTTPDPMDTTLDSKGGRSYNYKRGIKKTLKKKYKHKKKISKNNKDRLKPYTKKHKRIKRKSYTKRIKKK